jgi:LmbE family N-acetylglucosaminyl deacetylase
MERKPMTIMAIGGHIGDMELTAGGVLAKHSLMGDKIITVALTAGEKGNPPEMTTEEYRIQKVEEANKFAEMLNGEAIVLAYKDGELPDNDEVKYEVCDLIRKYKPNILITHWKNSMHKDHIITNKIVVDAQFYAGVAGFQRENPAHYAAGPYFAENWEDPTDFKPYIYIDISEGYELWKKAVATHWFVTGSKSFKYLEYYDHLSFVRGAECRKGRAQAFAVDPMQMRIVKDSF